MSTICFMMGSNGLLIPSQWAHTVHYWTVPNVSLCLNCGGLSSSNLSHHSFIIISFISHFSLLLSIKSLKNSVLCHDITVGLCAVLFALLTLSHTWLCVFLGWTYSSHQTSITLPPLTACRSDAHKMSKVRSVTFHYKAGLGAVLIWTYPNTVP